jgi:steroid 5-alpha reductase family enzyme
VSVRHDGVIAGAMWPATVGALAVLYASVGDGAWPRRSAIAWMMGSWGARLAVQHWYSGRPERAGSAKGLRFIEFLGPREGLRYVVLALTALIASLPALLASFNREPDFSIVELIAGGLWLVGFAGEATADRQRLRFENNPANEGLICRTGLWRHARHVDWIFEGLIWTAYLMFAAAALSAQRGPSLAWLLLVITGW